MKHSYHEICKRLQRGRKERITDAQIIEELDEEIERYREQIQMLTNHKITSDMEKQEIRNTDDLISRAEAMDASEKFIKDCNPDHFVGHQKFIEYMDNAEIGSFGKWQFANGFNMGLTAVEVAIRKLPSAQQWIPCSERLPAITGHYLCSFKKPNRIDNIFVDLAYWTGGRWYGYLTNEINAWMPLPKPYEVEE